MAPVDLSNETKNWLKAALALKHLKNGLLPFVDNEISAFQNSLKATYGTCNQCLTENVLQCPTKNVCLKRHGICQYHDNGNPLIQSRLCPNGVCNKIRDTIINRHFKSQPMWKNTDANKWSSNAWEVAKCFLPPGSKDAASSADTDCTGVLSLCLHCKPLTDLIDHVKHTFEKNRANRNTLMHSGRQELSDADRTVFIQDAVQLVSTYQSPTDRKTQDCIDTLITIDSDGWLLTTDDIVGVLEDKINAMRLKQEELEAELKAIMETVDVHTDTISDHHIKLDSYQDDIKKMDDELREVNSILQRLDVQNDAKQIQKLLNDMEEIRTNNENICKQIIQRIDALETKIKTIEQNIVTLDNKQDEQHKEHERRLARVERELYRKEDASNVVEQNDPSMDDEASHLPQSYYRGQHASERDLRSMSPVNEGDPDPDRSDTEDSLSSDEEGPPSKLCLRVDQLELAENALMGHNTIICSGTGTGKTWVALHVVEKHLQQQSNVPRKVAFMARTGVLIKQQSDRFKRYLPFQTKLFSGEVDDTKMINAFLPTCDILCFTPQIVLNNLESGGVASLSEFSLLILDECHHTRGDEPYINLMRQYLMEKHNGKGPLPQIVGLTASIGVGKSRTDEDAVEYLLHMCALLDVRYLSTVERNKEEYLKHTQDPEEQVIAMEQPTRDPIKDLLKTIIDDTEEKLMDAGIVQPELNELFFNKCPPNKESQEYNKWTVEVIKKAQMSPSIDDDTSRDISMCAKYLNNYNAAIEVNSLLRGSDVVKFLADRSQQEDQNWDRLTRLEKELLQELKGVMKKIRAVTRDIENPNVIKLTRILQNMLEEKGDDSSAIVFVKARATCKALACVLDEKLEHVKVLPLYGKDHRGFEEGMSQAVQNDTIEKFKSGEYKVLVSTSVGTEGLDVPACNIVLSYNYMGNEITKTQMKGRIRKEGGTNVVMGNAKIVEKDLINTYKVAMMHRAMARVKQLDDREMEKKISYFQEKELRSYRTKLEIDRYKKNKKSTHDDFEILCWRCKIFACYTSDVRMLNRQFIVMDKAFADKIITNPLKSQRKFDGFHNKYKMYCKNCPMYWGIVSINQGLPCRILKLESFWLKSLKTGDLSRYEKWVDVPYAVPKIEAEDLPKLFGDEATVEDV